MSIESETSNNHKNTNNLQKTHFSRDMLNQEGRSFIVSSINDDFFKNLFKEDIIISAGTNLSMSSLKSAKNKSQISVFEL